MTNTMGLIQSAVRSTVAPDADNWIAQADLRWWNDRSSLDDKPRVTLQQRWRSRSGAYEWRDVPEVNE